jgi:hypothetical protein
MERVKQPQDEGLNYICHGVRTLQAESKVLGEERFPDSTLATTWAHLLEEFEKELVPDALQRIGVQERHDAERYVNPDFESQINEALGDEMADIIILLAQLANKADIDLGATLAWKWEKVKRRPYQKNPDGVYRHVKEDADGQRG